MSNIAGKAYAMNVVTPMPSFCTWLQRLIFSAARAFPSNLGGLLGLSLIHFARWVTIRRDQWPDLRLQDAFMVTALAMVIHVRNDDPYSHSTLLLSL